MEIKKDIREIRELLRLIKQQARKSNASLGRGVMVAKEVLNEIRSKKIGD